MKLEFFIANRLKTGSQEGTDNSTKPSLNIAVCGMTLAIIIMILSITIVCGFKKEISNKIYNFDSHIKVRITESPYSSNSTTISITNTLNELLQNQENIKTYSLISEKPAIIKTDSNFKGVIFKGVDNNYEWEYIKNSLTNGTIPNNSADATTSEIIISQHIANQLNLNTGDKIATYFIGEKIKVRNVIISGIYNTNLEDYDKVYILGRIELLQNINRWNNNQGDYIGITCYNTDDINTTSKNLNETLNNTSYQYNITSITNNNASYFTWLELLDMNVIIIIIIMLLVSIFTLISGMLMIVLERINMIGIMETLGASNNMIRQIFIHLTNKLILRSLIIGNLIGIGLSLLQQEFHIIKLNPEAYYIDYVPIEIKWWLIIGLNIGIIIISYISLLAPSHIISKIEPNKSIRFE